MDSEAFQLTAPMLAHLAGVVLAQAGGFNFNLFDVIVLLTLGGGLWRGKQNGMSGEHMELFRWLAIMLVAGLLSGFLGQAFASWFKIRLMWANVLAYVVLVAVVIVTFAYVNSKGVSQIWEADTFGRWEYPLGMLAGMVRMGSILLVILAILNARLYTAAEVQHDRQTQIDEVGSTLVPTVSMINFAVFHTSYTGPVIRKAFKWVLLPPLAYTARPATETLGQKKTRTFEEAIK